jgi:hypothetical protein
MIEKGRAKESQRFQDFDEKRTYRREPRVALVTVVNI